MPFAVEFTGKVKIQVRELAARARSRGEYAQFRQDLLDINTALVNQPLAWAELRLPTGGQDFTECYRFFQNLSVWYLVFEQRQAVEILGIETITLEDNAS